MKLLCESFILNTCRCHVYLTQEHNLSQCCHIEVSASKISYLYLQLMSAKSSEYEKSQISHMENTCVFHWVMFSNTCYLYSYIQTHVDY